MDANERVRLLAKIKQQLQTNPNTEPLVTLEEFFDGNDDLGSIGCNLPEHPGLAVFYDTLQTIRQQPETQKVLVAITETNEDDPGGYWPFSDHVYILTRAQLSEVEGRLSALDVDEVGEGYPQGVPAAAPPLQAGYSVYYGWWD